MDWNVIFLAVAIVVATVVVAGCLAMMFSGSAPTLADDDLLADRFESLAGGFLPWRGGECPVPKGTLVDVQYRNWPPAFKVPALTPIDGPSAMNWADSGFYADIVAWRLHQMDAPVAARFMPAPEEVERDRHEVSDRLELVRAEAAALGSMVVERDGYHLRDRALRTVARYLADQTPANYRAMESAMRNVESLAILKKVESV